MSAIDKTNLINPTIEALLKNTNEFIFVKDKNFRYIGASTAYVVNCVSLSSVNELVGKTDYEIFKDPELAQKYRKDDEELFSLCIAKKEYEECYGVKDGRKRYCKTTKYLIKNEFGEPIGILGTFYDITEQVEMRKEDAKKEAKINRQGKIFKALKDVYNSIIFLDINANIYSYLGGEKFEDRDIETKGVASALINEWMANDLTLETRESQKDFFNLSTFKDRLCSSGTLTTEVETKYHGWLRISIIPVDYEDNGAVATCLWVSESISDEIKTRGILENRIAILNALRSIYHLCVFMNLKEDNYFIVSVDESNFKIPIPQKGELSLEMNKLISKTFTKQNRKEYECFFNLKTLPSRLRAKGPISKEMHTELFGWMRESIIPVNYDQNGNVTSCLWVCESIDEEKRKGLEQQEALKAAKKAAETDSLTGLTNRGGSEYVLTDIFASGKNGLLCLFDIDDFKHINDVYGHTAGDFVLKQIATCTKKVFRQKDIVARYGGDEFVAFAEGITASENAIKYLNRLLKVVENESFDVIGGEHIRISIGAILINESNKRSFIKSYQQCDTAMYRCKDNHELAYCLLDEDGRTISLGQHVYKK